MQPTLSGLGTAAAIAPLPCEDVFEVRKEHEAETERDPVMWMLDSADTTFADSGRGLR